MAIANYRFFCVLYSDFGNSLVNSKVDTLEKHSVALLVTRLFSEEILENLKQNIK